MCRNKYDLVFYRVLYITLFTIGLTFTVILTSVFVDIDGILTLRSKEPLRVQSEPPQIREIYNHDQSESDSVSENESYNDNFDELPPDYDDTSVSQPSRIKRSTDGQKYRIKNPQVTKILTSHLASLLEKFDPDTDAFRRQDTTLTTERPKLIEQSNYDRLKEELVKQTKEMEEDNINDSKDILIKNLKNLFLDAVKATKHNFDEVARKIKATLEAYESLSDNSVNPTASVLLEPARNFADSSSKVDQESTCDSVIDQMMQCLRGRGPRIRKKPSSIDKEPKLLIKTTIDISSLAGKPVENLSFRKDEIMGVVKLVFNGKEIFVESQLDDVLELMRKHGLNVDSENNVISLGQHIPIELKKEEIDFGPNVDDSRRSLEELMRAYLSLSNTKHEQSYAPIYSVSKRRHRRHVENHVYNIKGERSDRNFLNEDEEEAVNAIRKRKVLKALVNKIETLLHEEDTQIANKKKAVVLKHWHIKKRMQKPLKSENNRSRFNKTEQFPLDYVVTTSPKPASSTVGNNEKSDITQNVQKNESMESAETGEVDIDYDNIMFYKDIPQRQQRPLNIDSVEFPNKRPNIYPLKNAAGSTDGYSNSNKNKGKENIKVLSGIENLIMSYSNIYHDLDALSNIGGQYSFRHGVSKRDLNKVAQDESSDEENHVHKSKYNILHGRAFLPFENYQDITNSESKRYRNKKESQHYRGKLNYLDHLGHFGDLPEEDLLKRKLKPAEILSLANILEASAVNYRKKRSAEPPFTINYPARRKTIKSKVIRIPFTNRQTKSKKRLPKIEIKNISAKKNGDVIKQDSNYFWRENFKVSRRKNNTKKNKPKYRPPKIRLKRDAAEYEDDFEASKSQSGRSVEKAVNSKNEDDADPGSISVNNEDSHSAQPAFLNSIIYSIKSRRNTLMSQYPQLFTPNFLKPEDEEDYAADSQQIQQQSPQSDQTELDPVRKQEIGLNQFLNIDFPTLSNLAQAVATPVEKPNKKNYKVTVKFSPKTAGLNKSNPGFNELHTTINKSYTENGMRYYTVFNVSEISKVEREKPPGPKILQKSDLLDRIRSHQNKVDAFMRKHQAVMDSHLKVFEDDANHLNKALQNIVSNINYEALKGNPTRDPIPKSASQNLTNTANKVMDPELPVHNANITLLNDETDKPVVSPDIPKPTNDTLARVDTSKTPNYLRATDRFRGSDSLRGYNGIKGSTSLRLSERHYMYSTLAPIESRKVSDTYMYTTPSNVMQEIVNKNVYLTEEILKKLDRNTEMLNTFLNRLITTRESVTEPPFTKKFPLFKSFNNTPEPKVYYRKMNERTSQADTVDYPPNNEDTPKPNTHTNTNINTKKNNAVFDVTGAEKHNSNENTYHAPKISQKQLVFGMNAVDKRMSNENNNQHNTRTEKENNEEYFLDSPFANPSGKKIQHATFDSPMNDKNMMLNDMDLKKSKAVANPKVITLPFKVKINSTENSIP